MKYCPNCGKPIKQEWNICPYCGEDLSKYKKDKPSPISFGENNVVVKPSFEDIKQTIMEIENINIDAIDEEKFSEMMKNFLRELDEKKFQLKDSEIDKIIEAIEKKLNEGEKKFKNLLGDAETYFEFGQRAYNNGSYEVAIEYYDKALVVNPEDAKSWNNKGWALSKLRRYKEAIKCYDRALVINPEYVEAWAGKGNVLYKLKRYNEALKFFDKALEINSEYAYGWYKKGLLLSKLKKISEAIKCFDKALEIEPDNERVKKMKEHVLNINKRRKRKNGRKKIHNKKSN